MRIMTLIWMIGQARMTGDGKYESIAIVQVAVVACGVRRPFPRRGVPGPER